MSSFREPLFANPLKLLRAYDKGVFMKAEIKILHEMKKVSKEGKPYTIVTAVVKIEGFEFIRKFYVF